MGIGFSQYERPFAIRDAAGLLFYESAAFVDGIFEVDNSEAATAIGRGEAVKLDATNSVMPRWDYSSAGTDITFSTKCAIKAKRIATAADTGLIGIALENIPVGATGRIVSAGISAVKCLASGSATLGAVVGPSATAGSVISTAPAAAGAVRTLKEGTQLGIQVVPFGVGAGLSGSTTQLIVLIAQA